MIRGSPGLMRVGGMGRLGVPPACGWDDCVLTWEVGAGFAVSLLEVFGGGFAFGGDDGGFELELGDLVGGVP